MFGMAPEVASSAVALVVTTRQLNMAAIPLPKEPNAVIADATVITPITGVFIFRRSHMKRKYHLIAALVIPLAVPSMSFAGWVCYDTRSTFRDVNGYERVKYRGCFKSSVPCRDHGANHFGRYSGYRATDRAYIRCRTGNPRFID